MNRALLLSLALAAACGRDDHPSASPQASSVPDSTETRVTASSGPIQISLILPKTRVNLSEGIWFQIELKNDGSEAFPLDESFRDSIRAAHQWETLTYVEVLDSSGTRIRPSTPMHGYPDPNGAPPPALKPFPELGEKIEEWRAAGITGSDLDLKIIEYTSADRQRQPLFIKPGERRRLPHWAATIYSTRQRAGNPANMDFVEFPDSRLSSGRKYKLRAVYNHGLSPDGVEFYKKYREPVPAHFVTMQTPFIEIELLP